MIKPELLAPAGDSSSLHAAVKAGADAVYLGLGSFNARRNADNFTDETFVEACEYAHLRGVRVYVTLNTIILPNEFEDVISCARKAFLAGADAFIVQDIGLAREVSRMFGPEYMHISTQMNIHSESGLEAASALGASRVTLARELSLEEIANLSRTAKDLGMETEVFVHGALCVCYSGQCLMSSLIGGRSANRGLCAQACRLPYELVSLNGGSKELRSPGDYLLSPKDLCGIDVLPRLVSSGVSSLKVEGRMKSADYVESVVSVYRSALDRLCEPDYDSELRHGYREKLGSVFSRGFTSAYLEGQRGDDMMSYQRPNNRGQFVGRVKSVKNGKALLQCEQPLEVGDIIEFWTKKGHIAFKIESDVMKDAKTAHIELNDKTRSVGGTDRVFRIRNASAAFKDNEHEPRIPVSGEIDLAIGQPLRAKFQVVGPDDPGLGESDSVGFAISQRLHALSSGNEIQGTAEGGVVELARSKVVSENDVTEHVDRMGSVSFALKDLQVSLDEGVGIGFSQIHHIRAEALDNLKDNILGLWGERSFCSSVKTPKAFQKKAQIPFIAAIATNPECARAAKRAGADRIYVPAFNYRRGQAEMAGCLKPDSTQAGYPKQCIPIIPEIEHDAVGSALETKLSFDPWEYVDSGRPVLVQSLGSLVKAANREAFPEIGPRIPVTNNESLQLAASLDVQIVWLSPELNLRQIEELAESSPVCLGLKICGAQELMVTEHCLLSSQGECTKNCNDCRRRQIPHVLRDRKGFDFPVTSDCLGRGHLYNSVALDLVPVMPDLVACGVTGFTVDTTFMTPEQTSHAVGRASHALQAALSGGEPYPKQKNTTSGHIFRGVL